MVNLELMDTCGQENYAGMQKLYYRNSEAILLVYDITNSKSFEDIRKIWLIEVKNAVTDAVPLILIGIYKNI